MDSRELTKEQCDWMYKELSALTRRLWQIKQRMKQRQFPNNDKMYHLANQAYDAAWHAQQHAQALACQGKMGKTFFFVEGKGISE